MKLPKAFARLPAYPGFRPGKAPQNVVEAKYRKEIQEELTRKLVQETTKEAIKRKRTESAVGVECRRGGVYAPDRTMRFTATLITTPEFELPEYKGIRVKAPSGELPRKN